MSGLVLPALAALAVGVPAAGSHRGLHPSVGARALALATGALALAVVAAVATVAIGFVSKVPWIAAHLSWCRDISRTHDEVPVWLGLSSLAALLAMGLAGVRSYRRVRPRVWAPWPGGGVKVIDDERPDAYAVGGRPGHVVVSKGMLALLDATERRVLLAHERSHLRHRHDRYITLAVVASGAVPVLGFVTRRLRLTVERWADEDAATEVGDRDLVARTIIRAALAKNDYDEAPALLGLGLLGVRARVDALLLPAPSPLGAPLTVALFAPLAALGVVGGSTLQVHHLLRFASHVCGL
jgi:Zn-dependent protease with chaperone function